MAEKDTINRAPGPETPTDEDAQTTEGPLPGARKALLSLRAAALGGLVYGVFFGTVLIGAPVAIYLYSPGTSAPAWQDWIAATLLLSLPVTFLAAAVCSVGLLKRREWARRGIIRCCQMLGVILLFLGAYDTWNSAASLLAEMSVDAATDLFWAIFQLLVVPFMFFVWVPRYFRSADIRALFTPAGEQGDQEGDPNG